MACKPPPRLYDLSIGDSVKSSVSQHWTNPNPNPNTITRFEQARNPSIRHCRRSAKSRPITVTAEGLSPKAGQTEHMSCAEQPADWCRLSWTYDGTANWKHMGASFPLKELLQWRSRELYLGAGIIPVLNNNITTTLLLQLQLQLLLLLGHHN